MNKTALDSAQDSTVAKDAVPPPVPPTKKADRKVLYPIFEGLKKTTEGLENVLMDTKPDVWKLKSLVTEVNDQAKKLTDEVSKLREASVKVDDEITGILSYSTHISAVATRIAARLGFKKEADHVERIATRVALLGQSDISTLIERGRGSLRLAIDELKRGEDAEGEELSKVLASAAKNAKIGSDTLLKASVEAKAKKRA